MTIIRSNFQSFYVTRYILIATISFHSTAILFNDEERQKKIEELHKKLQEAEEDIQMHDDIYETEFRRADASCNDPFLSEEEKLEDEEKIEAMSLERIRLEDIANAIREELEALEADDDGHDENNNNNNNNDE